MFSSGVISVNHFVLSKQRSAVDYSRYNPSTDWFEMIAVSQWLCKEKDWSESPLKSTLTSKKELDEQ